MNAEDFYQELKDALDYFGLSWRDKNLVALTLVNDGVMLSYLGRSVLVKL